ncbi:MAG: UDP-3-O-acyl-N-acetylglucosamine deacetylase [Armatimonadota bacterium]|nr:UDP-3-O-acyl-N-acetylglucosamine deacetylase [Armatimonadota bacterium]MDR5697515.1 UDP-3-O-acyl-N-acetylglucosamine deacetylase [Armatimonadota bacterium]
MTRNAVQGGVPHRTIRRAVEISGVGIHSGRPARVRIHPSQRPGIVLVRGHVETRADLDAVTETSRRTVLAGVATVEHLMAAAFALGITALRVEVAGDEVPIADGSAKPFADALADAGIRDLPEVMPRLRVVCPVWVARGDALAAAFPADALRVTYVVALRDAGFQVWDGDITPQTFMHDLAPARTWGYADEADGLRAAGLATGADAHNTLILEGGGYRNAPRFSDEPVRHKVVDLIGDLALLAAGLEAHVVCLRGGHGLHLALARKIREAVGPPAS